MTNNEKRLNDLFNKYLNNQLTKDEYNSFWQLMNEEGNEFFLDDELKKLWSDAKSEEVLISDDEWKEKILFGLTTINNNSQPKPQGILARLKNYRIAAAVVFLLVFSSVLFIYYNKQNNSVAKNTHIEKFPQQDVAPGGDKAVLTLADGSTIILDSAGNGIVANQSGTKIIKKEDGQLLYSNGETVSSEMAYNLLATPRGGQYKITLPDGSKVWLNAASSLKYPVAFTGQERKVEITGEAYFEIAKNPAKPFKVQFNKMEVEVLGTHFNIKAYSDEESIKTTLLEGKVKVSIGNETKQLVPGQQAQIKSSSNIKVVDDVDLEETMAWKEGNFQFENTSLQDVMRQLSRWYDVEISYRGTIHKNFIGSISRDVKLSQVLSMLQQTSKLKFVIEGKNIIVYP